MNFLPNKNIYLIFSVFSFLLVFFKIICQTAFFKVPVDLTTILLLNDSLYFPLINSFSELNLNPSYSESKSDLSLMSYPVLGLIINIIFYKLFNIYSFLILEFLCVVLFLLIFFNIFLTLNFSKQTSIFLSFLLFFLPSFFQILGDLNFYLFKILELNFSTFYSLRFPRPIISNLYLFGFLLFCAKLFIQDKYFKKNLVLATILMSLTLHSFFYLFIFQSILIILIYLYIFKTKVIDYFLTEFKFHLILFLILILNIAIYQIQLSNSEEDFARRIGLIILDNSQKKILINYFLQFFLKIEFLSLLLVNSLFLILNKRTLNIFYLFFISTIFGTILFILVSNRGIDYYHFNNWIITSGILNLVVSTFYLIEKNLFENFNLTKKLIPIASIILIFVILFHKNFNYYNQLKLNYLKISEYQKIDNYFFVEKEKIKNKEILNLNHNLFLILINRGFENFSIVPNSFWTPKKDDEIEENLFGLFNFFELDQKKFIKYFENELSGYRFRNSNTQKYFDRKYLANQLQTFDVLENYNDKEREYINKHSPIITHQLIIPKNELMRLKNKFYDYSKKLNPSVIILEKDSSFFKTNENINNNFCLDFVTINYKIYISKEIINTCS
jgi:hypothetical protein